jgi:hypothetical protein
MPLLHLASLHGMGIGTGHLDPARSGQASVVTRLGAGYELFRVVPGGLVPLGAYRSHEHELFGAATNYLAMERVR